MDIKYRLVKGKRWHVHLWVDGKVIGVDSFDADSREDAKVIAKQLLRGHFCGHRLPAPRSLAQGCDTLVMDSEISQDIGPFILSLKGGVGYIGDVAIGSFDSWSSLYDAAKNMLDNFTLQNKGYGTGY
jgi:hypothetical protein